MTDCAIVGIGTTEYYRRGTSLPLTPREMACDAILAACADAGLRVDQIDGFASFSNYGGGIEAGGIMETLAIPEVRFAATTTGGGGGSAGSIGLAQAAIRNGDSRYVVSVQSLQQAKTRYGAAFARMLPDPDNSFYRSAGLGAPGQFAAMIARRHMHKYGTRRDAFAEVAISTRLNASTNPAATMREPLTRDDYFASPIIADPLCKLDFCLESDGAVAIIVAAEDAAKDLAQKPVRIAACKQGASRDWGRGFMWGNMPDDSFASSGMRSIAKRLYEAAGMNSADIDIALFYDHFTPFVVMQLEDFGFCPIGEGGTFVESGAIRRDGGSIPVNTHGGNLSEAYIIGITHVVEAVRQIRGTAVNQIENAERVLVTGGPGPMPLSALILTA
jgi:acetyl-CoA acetyltransferase